MRISFDWLKSIIDIEKSAEEIGDILTSLGLEVEGIERIEKIKGGLKGVVIGEVVECVQHPNADRLSITKVKLDAESEPVQIVCGAPNVAVGQKVLVATIGTNLYPKNGESFTIKKSKIRGEDSNGMICAEDELGLSSDHSGIKILESNAMIGQSASDYLKLDSDIVFEIGLTPNRSDATSHLGVARDLAAWYKVHEKKDKIISIDENDLKLPKSNNKLNIKVSVLQSDLCPRYSGVSISGIKVGPSPVWLQKRLIAVDQKPINNIVDITNFILFQYGQPLHAFDVDKIKGKEIHVRTIAEGTEFTCLDGTLKNLRSSDLMICDGNDKPLCIAGVMGGIDSGVTDSTTSIFLESAYFNASSVRSTSMHHILRSNAAKIFEKGADPNMTIKALLSAVELILKECGGEISSEWIDIYPSEIKPSEIQLNMNSVNSLSGMSFTEESLKEVLQGLKIDYTDHRNGDYTVFVGTNKADVTREADVVEELCRVYGLDHIPIPEKIQISFPAEIESTHEVRQSLSNYLSSKGFNEIQTLSLSSSEVCLKSNIWKQEELVYINNTSNANLDVMLPSLVIGGLQSISFNNNRQLSDLAFYEFGKEYKRTGNEFVEKQKLGLFLFGNNRSVHWRAPKVSSYDFFELKSCVEDLLNYLGLSGYKFSTSSNNELFNYSSEYTIGKNLIVSFGEVSTQLTQLFDLKKPVYYAEWDIVSLMSVLKNRKIVYKEVSKFPSSRRDLAIVLDNSISYNEIETVIRKSASQNLKDISLFDIYKNAEQLGADKKSLALSFLFESDDHSLTSQELDQEIEKLIQQLETKLSAKVRR
ncbi:MAG: phenylalanine--tRNA ligase subunit beta [Saprospiraceae bacterium]|nr:phenylalanine--tRNA ligase subunit beta [Saprospiraceae bacterium]